MRGCASTRVANNVVLALKHVGGFDDLDAA
jgi:hypothetical protein